jgi:hypothetical protein
MAIQKYLNNENKIATLLLVPIVENIIREMAKKLGIAIFKEPSGVRPGAVYTLGHLLSQLEGRMDESWRRYLQNILIEPLSFNLRNEISHGLLINPGKEEASLLIHIVCHLRLQQIQYNPVQRKV